MAGLTPQADAGEAASVRTAQTHMSDAVTPAQAPLPAHAPRAYHSRTAWTTLLLVLTIGLAADLVSKAWAFHAVRGVPTVLDRRELLADPDWNVPHHQGIPALPFGLLDLQLVINRGAVFGIGENRRFFFIAFTLGALLAGLFVFGRLTTVDQPLAHAAIGLILAGGIGNLYDRIAFGVVRDFLHMLPDWHLPFGWTWWGGSPEMFPWVFNLADVMLLTGMGLLVLHMHRLERRNQANAKAAST
jgi:signal peptidase II